MGAGDARKIFFSWSVIIALGISSFIFARKDVDANRVKILEAQERKRQEFKEIERIKSEKSAEEKSL